MARISRIISRSEGASPSVTWPVASKGRDRFPAAD
jgi:hypothetical protein